MNVKKTLAFKTMQILFYIMILFVLFYPYSYSFLASFHQGGLTIENTFMIQYDYIRQGIPYYREFFRLAQEHSLFWSWNTFLGNAFYTSKALFLIGDPYAWIGFLLFGKIHYVPTVLFLLTGFKLLLAGLFCSGYIKKLGHTRSVQFFFGMIYMLSGWSMVFLEQIQFLSFYSLIPLFLSGIEDQLHPCCNTWNFRFYFADLLLLSINYYLLWPLCLYAILYWIIRWRQTHDSFSHSFFWKNTGKLLFIFLLAVGTSAPLTFPSLFTMLKSPRLNGSLNHYDHWSWINVCAILMNFFIPFVREEHMLYHDYWYYFYQIGIYGGTALLLLTSSALCNHRSNRLTRWNRVLLALVLVTLTAPQFGLLFHRTYSLRYTFIVLLALMYLAAQSFSDTAEKKPLFITFYVLEAILFLLAICIPHFLYSTGLRPRFFEQKMLWAAGGFLGLNVFFLTLRDKKIRMFFLTLCTMTEMLLFANHSLRSQSQIHTEAEYLAYDEELQNIIHRLHQMDSGFFRVDLETGFETTQVELANVGMYYGLPSLSGYDSLYESALRDYLQWNGQYPDTNWDFHLQDPRTFRITNARYTICSPKYQTIRQDSPLFTSTHFAIYKNPEAIGTAYTLPLISTKKLHALAQEPEKNMNQILNLLYNNMAVDMQNTHMDNGPLCCFDPISYTATTMDFAFELPQSQLVFFSIPKADGWQVQEDGNSLPLAKVNGGFIGLQLSPGMHHLHFSYSCPDLKTAIPIALCSIAIVFYMALFRKKID